MTNLLILLFNFAAGTFCLIYGVNLMSSGLEQANPRMLSKLLTKFTSSVPLAFVTGTVMTAILQSSTAVTVITVGLVNSGLMKLIQAVGVIYGANIGTTVTAQLMSFKLTNSAIPLIALGLLVRIFSKKRSIKSGALALTGLGLMFLGITVLNWGIPYIRQDPILFNLLKQYGSNPLISLIFGVVATMLVHSSSATVGLTIVLYNAGFIGVYGAMGLMLGDNIGTCITAQMSSIGANTAARRTAWAHTLYNVIGAMAALIFMVPFIHLVQAVTSFLGQDPSRFVANAHTVFNLASALVFLPLTRYYVRFITWIIPES